MTFPRNHAALSSPLALEASVVLVERWFLLSGCVLHVTAAEARTFVRTKFPLLAAGSSGSGLLLLGGGGGSSKTGVPNSLMLCSLVSGGISERGLHATGDEAVTSLSVDASGASVACVQSNSVVVYTVAPEGATSDGSALLELAQRLRLAPASEMKSAASDETAEELPLELRPYCIRFAGNGQLLAVGMEDGGLLLFGLEDGTSRWSLKWRQRAHTKELKDCW